MRAGPFIAVSWLLSVILCPAIAAGEPKLDLGGGRDLELYFMTQFWSVATFGAKDVDGQDIQNRNDIFIRRGRIGVRGHFRRNIRYNFNFAYDGVGLDIWSASTGSPQSHLNENFFLWDAFVSILLKSDWAHLTVGYFRPQVGRESITTAFAVNSLIKALPNFYLREHVLGRSLGRETGVDLGGRHQGRSWSFSYNLGFFDTTHRKITGDVDTGHEWAPLWAGRLTFTFGDPEMESYGIGYRINYFGTRQGVTLAVNGSYQGQTNQTIVDSLYVGGFRKNASFGTDLLANFDSLNLSAEYDWMQREFCDCLVDKANNLTGPEYTDRVWFVRAGYGFRLGNGQVIEPTAMITGFTGEASSAIYPNGEHEIISAGLNWYVDRNFLKLNLFYHWTSGSAISRHSVTGQDEKGDFLGLGLQLVF